VDTRVKAPSEVSGDIAQGQKLGQVLVTVDGRLAGASPLVAAEAVEAATLLDKCLSTIQNPLILLPAGLIVILVGLLLGARGRRPEPNGEIEPEPEPESKPKRRKRLERGSQERTPEERRQMHEERMRRRGEREGPQ
jgi:hypothetical protein